MNTLEERISAVCYQHIMLHLAPYRDEPDIEKCLPGMQPKIFAAFAMQACYDVAELIAAPGHYDEICNYLSPCLNSFARALESYAPVLLQFEQMAGQAHQAAWNNGASIGEWAVDSFGAFPGLIIGLYFP